MILLRLPFDQDSTSRAKVFTCGRPCQDDGANCTRFAVMMSQAASASSCVAVRELSAEWWRGSGRGGRLTRRRGGEGEREERRSRGARFYLHFVFFLGWCGFAFRSEVCDARRKRTNFKGEIMSAPAKKRDRGACTPAGSKAEGLRILGAGEPLESTAAGRGHPASTRRCAALRAGERPLGRDRARGRLRHGAATARA